MTGPPETAQVCVCDDEQQHLCIFSKTAPFFFLPFSSLLVLHVSRSVVFPIECSCGSGTTATLVDHHRLRQSQLRVRGNKRTNKKKAPTEPFKRDSCATFPMPSSSSAAAAQADTFSPLHLPLLTLIAVCAAQCVQYRSTEECLDSLFSTPVAHSSESDLPPQKAFQGTENATEDDASVTLSLLYPEVRVLECVHHIRSDLRKLQECPEHARKNLTEVLVTHVDELCQIIPDPLFGALALATRSQVSEEPLRDGEAVLTKPQRCLLERQTLQVVEKLQQEVLAQSHGLTTRCTALTLRYQHHVPF